MTAPVLSPPKLLAEAGTALIELACISGALLALHAVCWGMWGAL